MFPQSCGFRPYVSRIQLWLLGDVFNKVKRLLRPFIVLKKNISPTFLGNSSRSGDVSGQVKASISDRESIDRDLGSSSRA